MDFRTALATLSGILAIGYVLPYIWNIIKGLTKPHAVTWGIWSLASFVGAAAQFASGATLSIVPVLMNAIGALAITLLALKYGVTAYHKIDAWCFALGLLAIVLWAITREPLVAIILAILADLIAAIPTIIKAWKDPGSETAEAFFIAATAALLGILASTSFSYANVLFPAYLFLIYGSIGILSARQHSKFYRVELE